MIYIYIYIYIWVYLTFRTGKKFWKTASPQTVYVSCTHTRTSSKMTVRNREVISRLPALQLNP